MVAALRRLMALVGGLGAALVDEFFWGLGIVLVVFGMGLIAACCAVYYWHLMPYVFPQMSLGLVVNFAVSIWLLVNIAFNYVTAVITQPGQPARLSEPPKAGTLPAGTGYCRRCVGLKPPRTHHCSICKKCVFQFDHHCPWMHNCIGHYNRRYFVLTLVYLCLGCVYYSFVSYIPFYAIHTMRDYKGIEGFATPAIITFTFVLAVAMAFSVGALMSWHLYLVGSGQTSVEFYINQFEAHEMRLKGEVFVNEYNLGGRWNFYYFFNFSDTYPWWMILLPVRVPPVGDGTRFVTIRDNFSNNSAQANAEVILAKVV